MTSSKGHAMRVQAPALLTITIGATTLRILIVSVESSSATIPDDSRTSCGCLDKCVNRDRRKRNSERNSAGSLLAIDSASRNSAPPSVPPLLSAATVVIDDCSRGGSGGERAGCDGSCPFFVGRCCTVPAAVILLGGVEFQKRLIKKQ